MNLLTALSCAIGFDSPHQRKSSSERALLHAVVAVLYVEAYTLLVSVEPSAAPYSDNFRFFERKERRVGIAHSYCNNACAASTAFKKVYFECIKTFYNRRRLHTSVDGCSPDECLMKLFSFHRVEVCPGWSCLAPHYRRSRNLAGVPLLPPLPITCLD